MNIKASNILLGAVCKIVNVLMRIMERFDVNRLTMFKLDIFTYTDICVDIIEEQIPYI